MDCDVRKQGNVWSYGDTKFWPETDVDFYSYSPTDTKNGNVDITVNGDKKITGYEVPGDEDLLYALNLAEKKAEHEANNRLRSTSAMPCHRLYSESRTPVPT